MANDNKPTVGAFPPESAAPARLASNTRVFQGDGGTQLVCPGLLELHGIQVGTVDVPLTLDEQVITKLTDPPTKEWVTVTMFEVDKLADGTPFVRRSIKSNDGIWQDGENIYVTGKWSGDAGMIEKGDNVAKSNRSSMLGNIVDKATAKRKPRAKKPASKKPAVAEPPKADP